MNTLTPDIHRALNVLGAEASGAHIALAALRFTPEKSQLMAAYTSDEPRTLSRELVSRINDVLSQSGWKLSHLDAIAVGLGPGSWTSLRITLATCKTLAQACEIELCGIPTFDAWAHAAWAQTAMFERRENALVLVTARSRPDEIYGKIFAFEYSNLLSTRVIATEEARSPAAWCEVLAQINNADCPIMVCGEARETVAQIAAERHLEIELIDVPVADVAFQIAHLGAQKAARGDHDDALFLQPLYIGVSNAERVWQAKQAAEKTSEI